MALSLIHIFQAGHQCYVVCPSVEEGETESGKAAQVWAETLRQRVFPDLQVGLLHGRMKGPEKEAAMAEFARGKTQILVATTVIEVGVDVPNATAVSYTHLLYSNSWDVICLAGFTT